MPIYPISCQGTPAEQKTCADIRSAIMGSWGKAILQPVQGSSSQTLQFTQLKWRGPCNSTANIHTLVKAVFTTKRQLRTDSSAVSTITPRRSSPHVLVTGTVTSPVILTLMKGTLSSTLLITHPSIPSSCMEVFFPFIVLCVLYRSYCTSWTQLRSEEFCSRSYSKSGREMKRKCWCPRAQLTPSQASSCRFNQHHFWSVGHGT